MGISVFHRDEPSRMVPFISSDARLVVWPGVGAHVANMNYVQMTPGEANEPHSHDESEDSIYILAGCGVVQDFTNGESHEFGPGDVIHVPEGIRHAVCASKGDAISSIGGPCPPDRDMLAALGVGPDGAAIDPSTTE